MKETRFLINCPVQLNISRYPLVTTLFLYNYISTWEGWKLELQEERVIDRIILPKRIYRAAYVQLVPSDIYVHIYIYEFR